MLDSNKKYLSRLNKDVLSLLKETEKEDDYSFEILETRRSIRTLILKKDGEEIYFHSKYDPIREARSIIDSYDDIDDDSRILFIGTGLGYHIEEMLSRYPNIKSYIYEPIPKLMNEFFKEFDINRYSNNINGFNIGENYFGQSLNRFLDVYKNIKIVILPSHENHFKDVTEKAMEDIVEYLKSSKDSIYVNLKFQNRWILNSMKNLKYNLDTMNIFDGNLNKFNNIPAILVSAGPSLNYEIDNLKYIKENKLAYIFAAGSTINALINNDIYPDYVISYDPGEHNIRAMSIVNEKNINSIPLIYGSTVTHEILEEYTGELSHVLTSQDTVSNYYLNSNFELPTISDASTVAVISLDIIYKLGFRKIVLVGQNFGYLGEYRHAKGRDSDKVSDEVLKDAIKLEGVDGDYIYSNDSYKSMKENMELYIKYYENVEIFNTTVQGANIKGTRYKSLSEIINNELKVKKGTMEKILYKDRTDYNLKYLDKMKRKMDREFKNLEAINKNYLRTLSRIDRDYRLKDYNKLEKSYAKLDNDLRKVENNDFYRTFILPMNRVQYEFLANDIDRLNEIRDLDRKAIEIYNSFKTFIDTNMEYIDMIVSDFEEMHRDIENYLEGKDIDAE